jgi:hypothetical protein
MKVALGWISSVCVTLRPTVWTKSRIAIVQIIYFSTTIDLVT